MPKKKTQRNGFYWFMQDILPGLRREGRVFPNGMADVVVVALPRWKALHEKERERYENVAKEQKKRETKAVDVDKNRLDNQGNSIANRRDEDLEENKRRLKERKTAASRWPDDMEGIMSYPFYFVSFQYLCETEEKEFIPCEVALIEWSLQDGISRTYHKFIEPGGIPIGYRFACQSHSDDTHQIPIDGFEQADANYRGIWIQIENFLNQDQHLKEYPPVYCFCAGDSKNWKVTDYCMRWLHTYSSIGRPNTLHKVYAIEDMIQDLYHIYTDFKISISSVQDMLSTNAFDYERNTKCGFHDEKEVKHCALGICKRYAFALSDALAPVFNFELTPSHLPTKQSATPAYTVIAPSAVHIDTGSKARGSGAATGGFSGRSTASGPFPARDIRYHQADNDSDDEGASVSGRSTTSYYAASTTSWASSEQRLPPPPSGSGPWAKTAAITQKAAPSIVSDDDFPALGGMAISKPKYAGRVAAPSPAELPKPATWNTPAPATAQQQPSNPTQQRLPNSFPQSAKVSYPQAPPQKRTLCQAVAEVPKPKPQQPLSNGDQTAPPSIGVHPAGMGRGYGGLTDASRSVNSNGFKPGGAQSEAVQGSGRPTLSEAVLQKNVSSSAGMNSTQQTPQPNAWGVTPTPQSTAPPAGVKSDTPSIMQPSQLGAIQLSGFGRGRGRGMNPGAPRQAGGGSGMKAPPGVPRPPPGFKQ